MLKHIKSRLTPFFASPTRKRLADGAIWGGVATAGSRAITVVSSFFLARILGQVGFGEYGMVNSTAGMVSSLAGMGIGLTVTRHVAQFKNTDTGKVGRILALSLMVTMVSAAVYGVAFVVLAPWLAEKTIAAPHLGPMLQISAITVALGVINGVQTSSLAGVEAFRARSYLTIGTGITQTILVLAGAWLWGLKGAIAATAAAMIITVFVTRLTVERQWKRYKIRPQWREAAKEWRVLVNFSLPTFLTMVTIGPVYWACNAFLANRPNGYAELGIFNAAVQWQSAIQMIPTLMGTAMIPIMSERIGALDKSGALRMMVNMIRLNAVTILPVAIVISLLSPVIMAGYGKDFANGYWAVVLLTLTAALNASISVPSSHFVVASGNMWHAFLFNTSSSLALLTASWFMAPWGAEGLSGARFISVIIHSTLLLLFVKKVR